MQPVGLPNRRVWTDCTDKISPISASKNGKVKQLRLPYLFCHLLISPSQWLRNHLSNVCCNRLLHRSPVLRTYSSKSPPHDSPMCQQTQPHWPSPFSPLSCSGSPANSIMGEERTYVISEASKLFKIAEFSEDSSRRKFSVCIFVLGAGQHLQKTLQCTISNPTVITTLFAIFIQFLFSPVISVSSATAYCLSVTHTEPKDWKLNKPEVMLVQPNSRQTYTLWMQREPLTCFINEMQLVVCIYEHGGNHCKGKYTGIHKQTST